MSEKMFLDHYQFEIRKSGMYYIDDDNKEHKVVYFGICANGLQDICIAKTGLKPHDINLKKISDVDKKDIVYVPKGDICWIRVKPPLSGNRHAIIIDLGIGNNKLKEMVREIIRRFRTTESKDYAMYGGERYDENSQ